MPHMTTLHWLLLSALIMFVLGLLLAKAWWFNSPSYKSKQLHNKNYLTSTSLRPFKK